MRGGALIPALLLCLAGSAAHGVERADWSDGIGFLRTGFRLFNPTYLVEIEQSWPADSAETLRVEGFRGDLTIVADDEPSIRVSGKCRIAAENPEEAKRASRAAPPAMETTERTAVLRLAGNPRRRFSGDLSIHAPRSLEVQVRKGDGDLKIVGFASRVDVETAGEATLEQVDGPVRLRLERGDKVDLAEIGGDVSIDGSVRSLAAKSIRGKLTMHGDMLGRAEIESTGQLDLQSRRLQATAAGPITGRLALERGRVEVAGIDGALAIEGDGRWRMQASRVEGPLKLTAERGDLEVRANSGRLYDMELRLEEGDITLALPPDADYELEAQATEIDSDLPVDQKASDATDSRADSPTLRATTSRGRLRLQPL